MRFPLLPPVFIFAFVAVASGAAAQPATCSGGEHPGRVAELLFGRNIGRHLRVSEADWLRFVTRELTPRFPDGLTVTDAYGQWRSRDNGKIVRESSKHVEIVLPGQADDQARVDAAAAAYKREFHQQSVGIIVRDACVSF